VCYVVNYKEKEDDYVGSEVLPNFNKRRKERDLGPKPFNHRKDVGMGARARC